MSYIPNTLTPAGWYGWGIEDKVRHFNETRNVPELGLTLDHVGRDLGYWDQMAWTTSYAGYAVQRHGWRFAGTDGLVITRGDVVSTTPLEADRILGLHPGVRLDIYTGYIGEYDLLSNAVNRLIAGYTTALAKAERW